MCRFNLLLAPTVQRLIGTRHLQNRLIEMQPTQLPQLTFFRYDLNGHLRYRGGRFETALDAGILNRWGARDFDGRARRERTIYEHCCGSAARKQRQPRTHNCGQCVVKIRTGRTGARQSVISICGSWTERRVQDGVDGAKDENSIRRGFPLGEFWIQNDLAEVDDALKLAALSVSNDADQQALQELEKQSTRLRTWSDWLIDQNQHLALTEYYISSSTLDNDEQFQNSVACTKFLVSMLSSRTLGEDNSCL